MKTRAITFLRDLLIAAIVVLIVLSLISWRQNADRALKQAVRTEKQAELIRNAKVEFARRQAADPALQIEANMMMHPLAQVPVKERP